MTYSDTFFIILTFDLLLIALLKAFYQKFTKQLFLSVFAQRYANQYLKEENVFTERVTFLVTTIMLINISLFLAKTIFVINLNLPDFLNIFISTQHNHLKFHNVFDNVVDNKFSYLIKFIFNIFTINNYVQNILGVP